MSIETGEIVKISQEPSKLKNSQPYLKNNSNEKNRKYSQDSNGSKDNQNEVIKHQKRAPETKLSPKKGQKARSKESIVDSILKDQVSSEEATVEATKNHTYNELNQYLIMPSGSSEHDKVPVYPSIDHTPSITTNSKKKDSVDHYSGGYSPSKQMINAKNRLI